MAYVPFGNGAYDVFAPHQRPGAGSFNAPMSIAAMGAGGGNSLLRARANSGRVNNPWQSAMWKNYGQAQERPYGSEWKQGVANAVALGGKDYTGELRRMAQEDLNKQQTQFGNQLGAMGMRELGLAKDVQDDWAKRRTDASSRAAIEGQGMQINALDAMRGMLGSATGAELDRISQMISAATAGGGNYNSFMSMLIPLMEKMGYAGGSVNFGGSPTRTGNPTLRLPVGR